MNEIFKIYRRRCVKFKAEKQKEIQKERGGKLRQKVKLFGFKSAAKCLINVHDRVDEAQIRRDVLESNRE